MKTKSNFLEVKAVQDDSCHWYLIPNDLYEEFYQDSLNDEFIDSGGFGEKWSQYATDGDLNLVQLYIKKVSEVSEVSKPRYDWSEFPEWANFAVTYPNGSIEVHETMPKAHIYYEYWDSGPFKNFLPKVIKQVGETLDWRDSLEERPTA